jgi:putative addiction module component (TIGR02574 family)
MRSARTDARRRMNVADLDEVLRNALTLDVQDRASLAERLLASLDELSDAEADRLWADEAERRLNEYRAGRARSVPADEVHRRAQKLLG